MHPVSAQAAIVVALGAAVVVAALVRRHLTIRLERIALESPIDLPTGLPNVVALHWRLHTESSRRQRTGGRTIALVVAPPLAHVDGAAALLRRAPDEAWFVLAEQTFVLLRSETDAAVARAVSEAGSVPANASAAVRRIQSLDLSDEAPDRALARLRAAAESIGRLA